MSLSFIGLAVKNLPANAGDTGSTPESGRASGEGNGNLLQYSCLENPMDRGAWQLMGLQKSQTQLSNYKTTAKMSLKLSLSSTILCFCGLALNTIFSSDTHTICESSVYMASLDK